jgi:hypothetical protein
LVHTSEHRIGGRLRAAGCRPSEKNAIVPERLIPPASKDSILPILADTLSRRRQWPARSLKLAIARPMTQHRIDGRALGAAVGMHEAAVCRAITWEGDTLNASYLAAKLGLAVRGLPEAPVFIRQVT